MRNVVAAARNGDPVAMRLNLQAMGKSLATDAAKVVPKFHVRADVAKAYGLTRPNKD